MFSYVCQRINIRPYGNDDSDDDDELTIRISQSHLVQVVSSVPLIYSGITRAGGADRPG